MTAQLTSNTSALIQSTVQSFLVEPLVPASVVLGLGPHIFDTNAPIRVPRIGATTAGWYGEGQTITLGDASFDEVDLLPSSLQSVKTIIPISAELVRSAVLGVTTVLEQRVVQDVALALDKAFISGSGTAGTNVIGLINQTGVNTATYEPVGTGATPAAGSLGDQDTYLSALATAYSEFTTPTHWLIHPTDYFGTVLKAKDSLGRLLFVADPSGTGPGSLFGIPVVVTSQVPQGTLVLVDITKVLVARDLSPSVQVLLETFAQSDEIGVKVTARFDIGLAHPQAVTVLTAAA
jgi:HK97 family phage major capsid protein